MNKYTKKYKYCFLIFTVTTLIFGIWAFTKKQVGEFKSPDGTYDCVIKRYKYESLIPRMPGQGSDYSCFLSIYEGKTHKGTIPIPISWMIHDIRWEEYGASLTAVGEWNFKDNTCYYWSKDGNNQISGL